MEKQQNIPVVCSGLLGKLRHTIMITRAEGYNKCLELESLEEDGRGIQEGRKGFREGDTLNWTPGALCLGLAAGKGDLMGAKKGRSPRATEHTPHLPTTPVCFWDFFHLAPGLALVPSHFGRPLASITRSSSSHSSFPPQQSGLLRLPLLICHVTSPW